MTDRLRRERTLPEGYQFGDARGLSRITRPLTGPGADYRDQHAVAAAESVAGPTHTHIFGGFNPCWEAFFCRCGARLLRTGDVVEREPFVAYMTANVIEGEHFDSDADHHRTIEGAR